MVVLFHQMFGLTLIIHLFKEILMLLLLMPRMFKEMIQIIKVRLRFRGLHLVLLACHIKLKKGEI